MLRCVGEVQFVPRRKAIHNGDIFISNKDSDPSRSGSLEHTV
jgi:hypothetical protein